MAKPSAADDTSADSGSLPIGAPLRVSGARSLHWDDKCDVLVAGFGAAGACAAIEAISAGAIVMIIDRFGGGGASAKSGGIVYAGGGTRHQKAAGFEDSPEAMYEYLRHEVGDAVSEATLRSFCTQSTAMIEWLESLGVKFGSAVSPRKTSYPADGYFLYYSGNETVQEYAGFHPPAPRGHRVKGAGLSGGELFKVLRGATEAAGAKVRLQAAVRRLVVDADTDAVLGAEVWYLAPRSATARRHRRLSRWADRLSPVAYITRPLLRRVTAIESASAQPCFVRARGGVVLSTGGFIFNRKMVARYAARYLGAMAIGTAGCDGSGIRLGQSLGAQCAHMERVSAWRFINPPLAWARGMAVDAAGRRFCNEEVYGARLGYEMCEHNDGKAWLVIDSVLRREAIREGVWGGLWAFQSVPAIILTLAARRGRSIEQLARRTGMDPVALEHSWETYNRATRDTADVTGKSREMLQPLEQPPFYALNISVASRLFPCPAITLGGLLVDETTGAVKTSKDGCVGGLYAAGRAAVGIASNHYVSGLALADCVWSGRRAGRSAALAALELASRTSVEM